MRLFLSERLNVYGCSPWITMGGNLSANLKSTLFIRCTIPLLVTYVSTMALLSIGTLKPKVETATSGNSFAVNTPGSTRSLATYHDASSTAVSALLVVVLKYGVSFAT